MLKEIDILNAIRDKLKAAYPGYPVYLDDHKEDFQAPCFFLKSILTRSQERQDISHNNLAVYITFFVVKGSKSAALIYEVKDGVLCLFWQGIQVKDRFLHIDTADGDTDGNDADTAQITLRAQYYDSVPDNMDDFDTMQKLHITEKEKQV